MAQFHTPVLLQPACDFLAVSPGKRYIDATLGGGGHAVEIIRRGAVVLGIDQDSDSLLACPNLNQLTKAKANFMFLADTAKKYGFVGVDGVLFDLGVSSWQLDNPKRGFSFAEQGPLDMRMDQEGATTAADLVNFMPETELIRLIRNYGEESQAARVARSIIRARPLRTTFDLAKLIREPQVRRRVFQALRIAVNAELSALDVALPQALGLLTRGGRLVVISFHSLEDRLVKTNFKQWAAAGQGHVLTPRPLVPTAEEIQQNPRSKSSKLRAFYKKI